MLVHILSIYCKTKPAAIRQRGRIFTALAFPTTPLDLWSRNSWNQVSVCHLHSCFADEKVTQNKKITSKIVNLELIEIFPERGAERLRHEGKGGWVHREPGLVSGRGRSHHLLGCWNGSSTTWRNFLHQVWSLAQLSTVNTFSWHEIVRNLPGGRKSLSLWTIGGGHFLPSTLSLALKCTDTIRCHFSPEFQAEIWSQKSPCQNIMRGLDFPGL